MSDPFKRQDGLECYLVESALCAGWYNQYPLQPLCCMKIRPNLGLNMVLWEHMSAEDFSVCSWPFRRFILLFTEVQQAGFWVCQSPALPASALPGWCSCTVTASAGEGPSDLAEKRVRLVPLKPEHDKGWRTSDMEKRAVLRKICIMNGAPHAHEKEYPVIKR